MTTNIFLSDLDPKETTSYSGKDNIFLKDIEGMDKGIEEPFVPEIRENLAGKFSQQKPSEKLLGHRGKLVGGKVGRAAEAAVEKPSLVLGKVPQALEQLVQNISEDPLHQFMRSISPAAEGEQKSVGRSVSEFLHGPVPERLKEGAQDIVDIEEFLMPFAKVPKVSVARKPSGMPSRMFEKVTKPTKVSPERYAKIGEKVEQDFRKISDKLFEKHPSYQEMKNDPSFRQKLIEGMEEVSDLASQVEGKVTPKYLESFMKRRLRTWGRETKGVTLSESEKAFADEFSSHINDVAKSEGPFNFKDLVDQYRKNSKALGEYFDPSKPKSMNTGKRDALLEYQRSIQELFETVHPDSEFSNLFAKENKAWADMAAFETAQEQVDKIFSGNKINFKEAEKILNPKNQNLRRNFSRLMGEKGFKDFELLLDDLVKIKNPYSLLKKADDMGFKSLAKMAASYVIHPSITKGKVIWDAGKGALKSLLDKPQLAVEWKGALDLFQRGKFKEAEKAFESLDSQMKQTATKTEEMGKKARILPEEIAQTKPSEKVTENIKPYGYTESLPEHIRTKYSLNEPTELMSKYDYDVFLGKKPDQSLFSSKINRNQWNNLLKEESYNKYYIQDGKIGVLGDFIKNKNIRKIYKDVLNVPVVKRNLGKGTGAQWEIDGETIYIKPGFTPAQFYSSISHEMHHAYQHKMRGAKYFDFNKPYFKQKHEIMARKAGRYVIKDIEKARRAARKAAGHSTTPGAQHPKDYVPKNRNSSR